MDYFITGGTGFIGRFYIRKLLQRQGTIYVLTRSGSQDRFRALCEWVGEGSERLVSVEGDLRTPDLGLNAETIAQLQGRIGHFCHFGAIYDLAADAESQIMTNVEGTRNAVQLAERLAVSCFQHVSSIAAGGVYHGVFREDMFEEAENLQHPYFSTKHASERVVRKECTIPFRIYRPSMVVGHSRTGEIDKVDGAYYFFKNIQKVRAVLPQWFPLVGIEGGRFNVVPVDYVVDAMDYLAHQEGRDGECFHLTDTEHYSLGSLINIFARAAHAPHFGMRLDTRVFGFIPGFVRDTLKGLPALKRVFNALLEDMGLPESVAMFVNYPTRYDNREAERALKGSGIECPRLPDYAGVLWDYWERHLDPDLFIDRSLEGNIGGRVVLITGASSGIGRNTALRLAEAGGHILLVARSRDKLDAVATQIRSEGGTCSVYAADIADMQSCDQLVASVLQDHGHVDVLLNNAGRSIRRSLEYSFDRFHDFERTMQINYFGAIRLIMGFAPSMLAQRRGHVINISSISALTPSPRFSAYVASKTALDAWTGAAAVEFSDRNVRFTTINMPLVRTPMIAATTVYDHMPILSQDEATDMIVDAVIHKPKRIATPLGIFLQVMTAVAPRFTEVLMNAVFRMFGDSAAARGVAHKEEEPPISNEQVALAALMKGVHF